MSTQHNPPHLTTPDAFIIAIAVLTMLLLTAGIIFGIYTSGNIAHQIRDKGNAAYQAEDYLVSLDHHLKASAIEPRNAGYRADLARTHHALAQYDKAIVEYTAALDLEPGLPSALCGRAETYETIGAAKLAQKDRTQAKILWSQAKFNEGCPQDPTHKPQPSR